MLHKEIPFLRICVPFCAGIVSGLFVKPGTIQIVSAIIIIAIFFILSLNRKKYSEDPYFGIAMSCSLFMAGIIMYRNEKASLSSLESETGIFACTLSDYPEEKSGSLLLKVRLDAQISETGPKVLKGSMLLYHPKDSGVMRFIPGDRLIIRCKPLPIVNRGNPEEFDYRFYMENLGIKYMSFSGSKDIQKHSEPIKRNLIHKALIIRRKIITMYSQRGVTEERLALVSALTLGEKSNLDNEQKQSFMKAGIMHIMAVSGLHAVILSMFIMNVLFFMKRRFNVLRILLSILFIWSFAFVTGLTPSVMRATLMFTFIQAGKLMHRRVNGINSVLASSFVLMIISPSVIFNAGFLLSYSAVIFIIAFYSHLYRLIHPGNKIADWVWQSIVVTVVAQTGTLSLTIMLFNRFPLYFIFTNLIIVPLSSLAIILGCLIPLLYPVAFLSGLFGLALDKLTGIILSLTAGAASLPLSGIEGIGMTPVQCILLFSVISSLLYIALSKKPISLRPVLFLSLLYILAGTVKDIQTKSTNELIVYNSAIPVTGVRTGKILNVYTDTSFITPEVRKHCATMGLRIKMHVSGKPILVQAGNRIIQVGPVQADPKIKPDFIIISDYKSAVNLLPQFNSSNIILTGNIRRIPPGLLLSESKSRVHLVRESGAYTSLL